MADQLAWLLFMMLAGHALCDFPLQGAEMACAKRPGGNPRIHWTAALSCHALIHGGAVALLTGLWQLGAAETIAHAAIDGAKSRGAFGMKTDQGLHIACKAAWALIAVGAFE